MGSWNETCGITHTPILVGDECVMVTIDKWGIDLECPIGYSIMDYLLVNPIQKGIYNDYGGLEDKTGVQISGNPQNRQIDIFFHRNVWDKCQNMNMPLNDSPSFPRVMKDLAIMSQDYTPSPFFEEFYNVAQIAYESRINILGGFAFRGCQIVNTEMSKIICGWTVDRIKKIEECYNKDKGPPPPLKPKKNNKKKKSKEEKCLKN